MTNKRSTSTGGRPTPSGRSAPSAVKRSSWARRGLLGLAALGVVAGAGALLALGGGGGGTETEYACDGPRVVVVDLSSQNRSPAQVGLAVDAVAGHLVGGAVCEEPTTAIAVAAGTPVLIDIDRTILGELRGPNVRARSQVARERAGALRAAVEEELGALYSAHPNVTTTSVPALLDAAAAHADAGARVVVVTTGVHDTADLTLNRPLAVDEGSSLADAMAWPTMPVDAVVAILGVAQVDTTIPVPGEQWPREVVAFNKAACGATGASTCNVLQVATQKDLHL